jgi:flagellar basal-body rod protein FlgB
MALFAFRLIFDFLLRRMAARGEGGPLGSKTVDILNTPTLSVLQDALDYSSARQSALAANIANINTPGYQRKDASFESVLAAADPNNPTGDMTAETDDPEQFQFGGAASGKIAIDTDSSGAMRLDGNNVDMDVEMGRLAKNQIYYQGLTELVSNQFSGLKFVIEEAK